MPKSPPYSSSSYLALAVILCCLMASGVQSRNLHKAVRRRSADSEDGERYEEGKILFGNFYDRDGVGPRAGKWSSSKPRILRFGWRDRFFY